MGDNLLLNTAVVDTQLPRRLIQIPADHTIKPCNAELFLPITETEGQDWRVFTAALLHIKSVM